MTEIAIGAQPWRLRGPVARTAPFARGERVNHALTSLAGEGCLPGWMGSLGGDEAPLVAADRGRTSDAVDKTLTNRHCQGGVRRQGRGSHTGASAEGPRDAPRVTDDANPVGRERLRRAWDERRPGPADLRGLAPAYRGETVQASDEGRAAIFEPDGSKVRVSDRAQVFPGPGDWREGQR